MLLFLNINHMTKNLRSNKVKILIEDISYDNLSFRKIFVKKR